MITSNKGRVLLRGPATPPVSRRTARSCESSGDLEWNRSGDRRGRPAYVPFAGLAPGFARLIQVNIQIPTGLTPGDQPVFVTVNGVPTNAGLITVK